MQRFPVHTTGVLLLLAARAGASSPCYVSPEAAAIGAGDPAAANSGFRMTQRRWDPLIGRNWVTIESCQHPERPAMTLPSSIPAPLAERTAAAQPAALPVVRAGETVRILYRQGNVRIEMGGVAQTSGNPGDTIRVRLTHTFSDSGSQFAEAQGFPDRQRTAIVRGPHSLELQP
jgi:hypothetical protein